MQIKKQQLELDMEQQNGFKLGKEYITAAVTICSDFGHHPPPLPKIKSATVSSASPSIFHEVMGPDTMILVF